MSDGGICHESVSTAQTDGKEMLLRVGVLIPASQSTLARGPLSNYNRRRPGRAAFVTVLVGRTDGLVHPPVIIITRSVRPSVGGMLMRKCRPTDR